MLVYPSLLFPVLFSRIIFPTIRKKYFVHIFPYYYIQFSYDSLSFLKGSSLPYPIFSISFRISCFLQDLFGIIIVRCFNKGFPVHFFSFEYFSLPLWDLLKGFPSCHFFSSFFFCIPLKICQKMLLSSSYYIRAPYKEQGFFWLTEILPLLLRCGFSTQHLFMKFSVNFFYIIISSLFISQLDNTTFSIRIRCIRTYAINKI